jgi:hypothetical protein
VRRAALLVVLLLAAALCPPVAAAAQPAPARAQQQSGGAVAQPTGAGTADVVVIGVVGLRWDHVDPGRTPVLARLAQRGARGALSVKAAGAQVTCPVDGWLTLGAGNRARSTGVDASPCTGALPPPGELPRLAALNEAGLEGTRLGALGSALREAGSCLAAPDSPAGVLVGGGAGGPAGCPVRIVDAGSSADLAAADAAVGAAAQQAPDGASLLVVGVSAGAGEPDPRLHVALAVGPSFPPGSLVSASTRRAPYVQLVDVAPTVLALRDVPRPAAMVGQPWRSVGGPPGIGQLVDLDRRAAGAWQAAVPFFVVLVGGLLAGVAVAALRRSWRLAELVGLAGPAALGASYLAQLVPWWRAPLPLPALVAVVAGLAAAAVAAAVRVRGPAGPAGALCTAVAVLLLVDLLTGARLQMSAVAGYSPLVAGRFAGIGNVAFGVLLASALLGTAWLSTRVRRTLPFVALAGVVVVVVDGAPPLGSDVGGVLALVPAYALLGMLLTGTRVSALRLLLAAAAGALVVASFAAADLARAPAERTHLGRFAEDLLAGAAGSTLRRKAEAVLGLVFANALTALLPLVVALAVLLLLRPPPALRRAFATAPVWRSGLVAVAAGAAVGFAVNDSGASVLAFALLTAAPATVAVTARAARGRSAAAHPG